MQSTENSFHETSVIIKLHAIFVSPITNIIPSTEESIRHKRQSVFVE